LYSISFWWDRVANDTAQKGTAHKLALPNRGQRLLEYSERASALGCMATTRKRKRVDPVHNEDYEDYEVAPSPDADLCASRTVVFRTKEGWQKPGCVPSYPELSLLAVLTVFYNRFKYAPRTVRDVLFPPPDPDHRSHKKSRTSEANALQMDIDGEDVQSPADPGSKRKGPSIVVETLSETFLISSEGNAGFEDKENTAHEMQGPATKYTISLLKVQLPTPDLPAPESDVAMHDEPTETSEAPDKPEPKTDDGKPVDVVPPADPVPRITEQVPAETEHVSASAPATEAQQAGDALNAAGPSQNVPAKPGPTEDQPAERPVVFEAPQSVSTEAPAPESVPEVEMRPPPPASDTVKATDDGAPGDLAPKADTESSEKVQQAAPAQEKASAAILNTGDDQQDEATSVINSAPQGDVPEQRDVGKDAPSQASASKGASSIPRQPRRERRVVKTVEVLQRNLCQDDLIFDADGISVLSNQIENGVRKGWKIEAKSWRWAIDELD
jgi:hypothetical protein